MCFIFNVTLYSGMTYLLYIYMHCIIPLSAVSTLLFFCIINFVLSYPSYTLFAFQSNIRNHPTLHANSLSSYRAACRLQSKHYNIILYIHIIFIPYNLPKRNVIYIHTHRRWRSNKCPVISIIIYLCIFISHRFLVF